MKKTELKRVLKPLVRQCIKEVLLEEGVLSNVVSEVVSGLSPLLVENRTTLSQDVGHTAPRGDILEEQRAELEEEKRRMLKEQKIKVLNATGFGAEIFEGVEALPTGGDPETSPGNGALSGVAPSDPGVDISGIMALGGHKWNKLV